MAEALGLELLPPPEGREAACAVGAAAAAAALACSFLLPLPVLISVDPLPASFLDFLLHIWKELFVHLIVIIYCLFIYCIHAHISNVYMIVHRRSSANLQK